MPTLKIHTSDLKLGMYVAELDRSWLDSPFLFQGFLVETQDQLQQVRSICEFVTIDTLKSRYRPTKSECLVVKKQPDQRLSPAPARITYRQETPIEEEIETAQTVRHHARQCIDSVFNMIRSNKTLLLDKIRSVVESAVDSIIRNPNASLCLTQLKHRDEYTAEHSVNVCVLSVIFARHLGLDRQSLILIGLGGLLHDIGKLKTALDILNKPTRLSTLEFEHMKTHPVKGAELLAGVKEIPESVVQIARSHHERLRGQGYPDGLTEHQIPVWTKMVAIIDVYDAITSDRCYHDGISPTQALTKMYGWREDEFDPHLLQGFIKCIGIYPSGSLVELHSGEVGLVIDQTEEHRLSPTVLLVLDTDKNPYYAPRVLDLAELQHSQAVGRWGIKRVLAPGSFNIDIAEHLHHIRSSGVDAAIA